MFFRRFVFLNISYQVLVILNEVESGLFLVNIDDARILKLLSLNKFPHDITFADTSLACQHNHDAFPE